MGCYTSIRDEEKIRPFFMKIFRSGSLLLIFYIIVHVM